MPTRKQHYDSMQKKKALSLLKSFSELIRNGEVYVEMFGTWQGQDGYLNLKLVVKETNSKSIRYLFD